MSIYISNNRTSQCCLVWCGGLFAGPGDIVSVWLIACVRSNMPVYAICIMYKYIYMYIHTVHILLHVVSYTQRMRTLQWIVTSTTAVRRINMHCRFCYRPTPLLHELLHLISITCSLPLFSGRKSGPPKCMRMHNRHSMHLTLLSAPWCHEISLTMGVKLHQPSGHERPQP
jgi:hypothetical protein